MCYYYSLRWCLFVSSRSGIVELQHSTSVGPRRPLGACSCERYPEFQALWDTVHIVILQILHMYTKLILNILQMIVIICVIFAVKLYLQYTLCHVISCNVTAKKYMSSAFQLEKKNASFIRKKIGSYKPH